MRFWDSSALAPLILSGEPGGELARAWLADDGAVVVWCLTRVELASAIERRAREGALTAARRRGALRDITRLAEAAHEVIDVQPVRARATALLARHALRAADALQLAAAQVVGDARPTAPMSFVTLDRRLAEAADREGLDVLSWPD
ncbi:MAG: type II toxin-antitoxin system VapC family toxin [Deltaproteobacteria bacterium]|nr:type II toxin-antitoxin system VapC family toxin [Deltaproteobacteria bacterium]